MGPSFSPDPRCSHPSWRDPCAFGGHSLCPPMPNPCPALISLCLCTGCTVSLPVLDFSCHGISLWTSVSSLSTKHGVCGFVQLQLGLAPYSFSYFLCHLLVKGFYPPLRPHLHILHEVGQTGCPSVFCSCFLPLSTLVFDEGPCRGSIPFYKPAPSLSGLEIKDRGSPFLLLRHVWVPRYLWADLWGRKKGGDSSAPEGSLGLHRPTW